MTWCRTSPCGSTSRIGDWRADGGGAPADGLRGRKSGGGDPVGLKAGPESESLSPLLPTGFAVLTVRTEGGICYLNLPKGDQYLMPEDETEQQRMVQGLVNSLCSAVVSGRYSFCWTAR